MRSLSQFPAKFGKSHDLKASDWLDQTFVCRTVYYANSLLHSLHFTLGVLDFSCSFAHF